MVKKLNPSDYCKQVSDESSDFLPRIVPEQILEALGGLANLYLEALIERGESELKVITRETFASEYVEVEDILQEISSCTGVGLERAIRLFGVMQKVFGEYFKARPAYYLSDEIIQFDPLGDFQVRDLNASSYHFEYRDPAAGDYDKFLMAR